MHQAVLMCQLLSSGLLSYASSSANVFIIVQWITVFRVVLEPF